MFFAGVLSRGLRGAVVCLVAALLLLAAATGPAQAQPDVSGDPATPQLQDEPGASVLPQADAGGNTPASQPRKGDASTAFRLWERADASESRSSEDGASPASRAGANVDVATALPWQRDDPAALQLWEAYAQRWRETKDLSVVFHQTIELAATGDEVKSGGRFYFAQPDLMLWQYLEGQPQTVVGDGQWLWLYQPDLEQVYKLSYDEAFGSGGLIALLAGTSGAVQRYRISERDSGDDDTATLLLSPREPGGVVLELHIDRRSLNLDEVVATDASGNVTFMSFEKPERNLDLDEALFSFTPPLGVDIIHNAG